MPAVDAEVEMRQDDAALSVNEIIKKQQREIEEQKRKVNELESKMASMEAQLEKYSGRKFACINRFLELLVDTCG